MIIQQAPIQDMMVLAQWNNGQIVLNQEALRGIGNFSLGQINMVCFEGFMQNEYPISQYISRSSLKGLLKSTGTNNFLLIRPTPLLQKKTHKYLYFLQLVGLDERAKEDLHIFASLISNVIVVAASDKSTLGYLSTVGKRVSTSMNKTRQMGSLGSMGSFGNIKPMKTSTLVFLLPKRYQMNQTRTETISEAYDQLMYKLQLEGIQNQVLTSYPAVKGFECSEDSLIKSSQTFQGRIMSQIEDKMTYQKENSQLMYGRIWSRFMESLCYQMNARKNGAIDVGMVEDDIVIDQGYQAYMAGVQTYHSTSLNLIDKNSRPDDNDLQKMLSVGRTKALEEFYARDGSNWLEYRKMLEDYINHKNHQVIDNYSGELWNRNLQILQSESNQVLDKINQSRTRDQNVISGYIGQMTRNYESQARGPQKYQIMNDYMRVFAPIAYQPDPQKQKLLRSELKRNQDLQKKINELKKVKNSGCCSKCAIM